LIQLSPSTLLQHYAQFFQSMARTMTPAYSPYALYDSRDRI